MMVLSACLTEEIAASPGVTLHFLGNEGVLFDATAQKLYAANTTATFIWCCLEDGLTRADMAVQLSKVFGVPRADAATYVDEILGRWLELGLMGRPSGAIARPPNDVRPDRPPLLRRAAGPQFTRGPAKHPAAAERHYRLLDTCFRIRFGSEALLGQLEPFLAPLATASVLHDALVLDLVTGRGSFVLYADGMECERCERMEQVVPMVKACLVLLALERSRDFCAIHAAAVGRHEHCVLFPGAAGSGKSTLAAALVAAGFRLLGDDTIVLARDSLEARPVPFGICVKSGAWDLLATRFPALKEQPIHDRLDGKRVRYLMPSESSLCRAPESRHKVRTIMFPHREPGAATALVALPRTEALSRLLMGFYPLADGLDAKNVGRLLNWIAEIECFELRFGSLDDGVERLIQLCP